MTRKISHLYEEHAKQEAEHEDANLFKVLKEKHNIISKMVDGDDRTIDQDVQPCDQHTFFHGCAAQFCAIQDGLEKSFPQTARADDKNFWRPHRDLRGVPWIVNLATLNPNTM